jgi:hypothetical protein
VESIASLAFTIYPYSFEQLEALNLVATWIYVICDNARYYRSN